jgi:hypothetical protein
MSRSCGRLIPLNVEIETAEPFCKLSECGPKPYSCCWTDGLVKDGANFSFRTPPMLSRAEA